MRRTERRRYAGTRHDCSKPGGPSFGREPYRVNNESNSLTRAAGMRSTRGSLFVEEFATVTNSSSAAQWIRASWECA